MSFWYCSGAALEPRLLEDPHTGTTPLSLLNLLQPHSPRESQLKRNATRQDAEVTEWPTSAGLCTGRRVRHRRAFSLLVRASAWRRRTCRGPPRVSAMMRWKTARSVKPGRSDDDLVVSGSGHFLPSALRQTSKGQVCQALLNAPHRTSAHCALSPPSLLAGSAWAVSVALDTRRDTAIGAGQDHVLLHL